MNSTALLDWARNSLRLLGAIALAVSLLTWAIDLAGWVYQCPYCQIQRSAIGLVGALMLLPDPRTWWVRYGGAVICLFGANVASAQLFLVYRNLTTGQPSNPVNFVLATAALFILVGQALLLFSRKPRASTDT